MSAEAVKEDFKVNIEEPTVQVGESNVNNDEKQRSDQVTPEVPAETGQLTSTITYIMDVLPDADSDYIGQQVSVHQNNQAVLEAFVNNALDKKDYPKRRKLKLFNLKMSVPEFLQHFPNPEEHFGAKRDGGSDPEYQECCLSFLRSCFTNEEVLQAHFVRTQYNLTKTFAALEKELVNEESLQKFDLKMEQNLHFLQEATYLKLKADIEAYLGAKEEERIHAEAKQELLECPICLDTKCLFEEMAACPEGHLFCKSCIKKFVETVIGENKSKFPCLEANCVNEFSLQTLQTLLEVQVFSSLECRLQAEEVQTANIPGLETCPFCPFSCIPEEQSLLFNCQKESCLKVSCRKCKEPDHLPLKCEEVENDAELKARKVVEERMSATLIRECPDCKRKFVKIDGCNHVGCPCGKVICYLCRQVMSSARHYCAQNTPMEYLHVTQVIEVGNQAKRELELTGVSLKHDPTQHFPK